MTLATVPSALPSQRTPVGPSPEDTQDWTHFSACQGSDPEDLFVSGAAQNRAKVVCRDCPVRTLCLADALDHRVEFGVWGGMTERERRALLRRNPTVTSWLPVLESAARQPSASD